MQHTVEWGMSALQVTFSYMTDCICCEERGECCIMIWDLEFRILDDLGFWNMKFGRDIWERSITLLGMHNI